MGPLWLVSAVLAILGLAINAPVWIAAACCLAGLSRVIVDLSQPGGFGAATIWGASMALTGLADATAMLITEPTVRRYFFLYAAEEYLAPAMVVAFLGGSAILLGFVLAERSLWRNRLPPIAVGSSRAAWALVFLTGVVALWMRVQFIQIGTGTLANIYYSAVPLVVFVTAREGCRRGGSEKWLWAAASLAYAEAVRAVLFEILRQAMLLPIASLLLGCVVGAGSLKPLRRIPLWPVVPALVVLTMFFATFGNERTTLGYGVERVGELAARRDPNESGAITVLARLTSLNQLTQVVAIAQTEGFEHGQTLAYMSYVFIPRFLWADKPTIAQGQWFAERAGLGRWREEGVFSNSINMTIGGEWYLNFGYLGTIAGGLLAGLWTGLFWNAARFSSSTSDPVSGAYAFLMLVFAWSLNVDTQMLPTVLAVYLLFWAFTKLFRLLGGSPVKLGGAPQVST